MRGSEDEAQTRDCFLRHGARVKEARSKKGVLLGLIARTAHMPRRYSVGVMPVMVLKAREKPWMLG